MFELVNETTNIITVNDMGIELGNGESLDIEMFTDKEIIESVDLSSTLLTIEMDGIAITYDVLIEYIKKLNKYTHLEVDTHAHNIVDDAVFETEKVNGKTSKITYYKDAAKTKKLREESIIRNINGAVIQIISEVYGDDDLVEETETQTLTRGSSGTVIGIETDIH